MSPFLYAVYKISKLAVYPLTWILILLLLALIASWRGRRKLLHACLITAFVIAYGLSLPPAARMLTGSIEQRYPVPPAIRGGSGTSTYDAVVVLAGGVHRKGGLRMEDRLSPESLDRLVCGRALMTDRIAPRLILSGGNVDPFAEHTPEAEIMARTLQLLGPVPGEVRVEPRSRTTYENAVETSRILGPGKRIALVTSALHMPRAMALFRRQDLTPTAFPCEYLTGARAAGIREYLPELWAFRNSSEAINEWVGLWLYTVAGKAGAP
ncbi:MAG: YdcF family protein [Nitrospirota bacterium]